MKWNSDPVKQQNCINIKDYERNAGSIRKYWKVCQ